MKKRGFTLVELLAVIVILGIVLSMVTINVTKNSNDRKKLDYENMVKLIEKNTELLVSENSDVYTDVTNKLSGEIKTCKILYKTLIDNNLIDETEVDPRNGDKINPKSYIKVSFNSDYDLEYKFINIDDKEFDSENIDYCINDNNNNFVFSIDKTGFATNKNVTINYPSGYTNEYSLDNGLSYQVYTGPINVTKNLTIIARTTNNGSVIDTDQYMLSKIDNTPPTISTFTYTSTSNSISVVAEGLDSESGISFYQFSKDNGATWTSTQKANTYKFENLPTGIYKVKVRAINGTYLNSGLGNNYLESEAVDISINNLEKPTILVSSNDTWTTSKDVTINYQSGYTNEYSLDNGKTWSAYNEPIKLDKNASILARISDGINTVYSDLSEVTKIDTVKPTLTMTAGAYDLSNTNEVYSAKFGESSGSVTCVNTSRSDASVTTFKSINTLGPNKIKCTATSGAGLKAEKTVTYNMSYTFNLKPNIIRATNGGYKSGTSIILPTGSSATQFGPYIQANTGCYQVIYDGNNLNSYIQGYKSYDMSANENFSLIGHNYLSSGSIYLIKLTKNYDKLEVVLVNDGTSVITIGGLKINYYGNISKCE